MFTQIPYPSGDEALEVIQKASQICSHPNRNEQKFLYKPLGMCVTSTECLYFILLD